MLTMSRSCNAASEQGSSSSWKESYRSTAESVESFEDSVDSDNSSNSSHASRSQSGSSFQPPIGCITTHSVSAVIRPEKKMPPIDPLQFVKIQKNELSKKAVEQIKLAEEVKITKEKIKEVEEEWQNNLMSWKSKRKLTKNNSEDELVLSRNTNRKTKTFSEILNEKARSGARIGYNLHRYADVDFAEELAANFDRKDYVQRYEAAQRMYESSQLDEDTMTFDQFASSANSELSFDPTESNLNRLLKSNSLEPYSEDEICRDGLSDVVVFNTTLLEEFSIKSDDRDAIQINRHESDVNRSDGVAANTQLQHLPPLNPTLAEESEQIYQNQIETIQQLPPPSHESNHEFSSSVQSKTVSVTSLQQHQLSPQKVHVPINDWKSSQCKSPKQSVPSSDDDAAHHNSSFEVEDEEDELDEELERLRLDQERSFKAKLYAFENLAKQEEEAARKAAESYRRRQQSRQAKLAAERSKSLGNIQQSSSSHRKAPVSTSHSISSSPIPVSQTTFSPELVGPPRSKSQLEKQSKSLQNLNSSGEYSLYNTTANSANSTIYNFTDKAPRSQDLESLTVQIEPKSTASDVQPHKSSHPKPTEVKSHLSQTLPTSQQAQNIYENITPLVLPHQHQPTQSQPRSPIDTVSDSNAIRNASQKLLQQQQQIYQNQPLPTQYQQHYPQEHYSSVPPTAVNFGFNFEPSANLPSHHLQPTPSDHPIQPTDTILNDKVINPVPICGYSISDDVGLPPIQITKSNQSGPNKAFNQIPPSMPLASANQEEEHLYVNQNQLLLNPSGKCHNPVYSYDFRPNSATYENYNPSLHYSEPNYENKTLIQKRMEDSSNGNTIYPPEQYPPQQMHPYAGTQNQYLFYPKPYSAASASVKPIVKQQPPSQMMPSPRAVPLSQNNAARYAPNGFSGQQPRVAYNQNHWLLQEAELRRQLDSMESSSTWLKNPIGMQQPQQHSKNGQPSVSGKKKCSSCMDELGKGCAAMVVESLSLFYHINCFRCSVCNVQLGNGTVGTDVRVRNNKLHCQNCYSNDEAGLKFSRV